MSLLAAIGLLAIGFVALVVGAEALVRGAAGLAGRLGISPLVIGLTVVAFGTSAPEVAVSVSAVLDGRSALAMGNVVGSNIFNVLFILGVSALILPLTVHRKLIRVDVPLMIGVSGVVWLMALDGAIGALDAGLLLAGLIVFTAWTVLSARREPNIESEPEAGTPPVRSMWVLLLLVAAGLGGCAIGARWLVLGAVEIAKSAGVSDAVIGLTIVAAGTSLPEVAASIMATIRGQRDLAIGNVVGSNLFNLLGILGLSGLVAANRGGIEVPPSMLALDLPVMLGVAIACLPVFFTGQAIARWEGAVFLVFYIGYTALLVIEARQGEAVPAWRMGLFGIATPLAAVGIAASVWGSLRGGRAAEPSGQ